MNSRPREENKSGISKRTRLAPTPSGFLHLGNVFSFALTAALAERTGARVLLRIDDLDRDRYDPEFVQDIFETLDFLAIPWDEGPRSVQEFESDYSQLSRIELYRAGLEKLQDNGLVFACSCSRSREYPGTCRDKGISFNAENVSWRLRTPDDGTETLPLRSLSGESIHASFPPDIRDFVIRKKDGYPAYQICSVLDDLYFGVDLIVRGEDLWSSSLAQNYLASRMGEDRWRDIRFYHHPLLKGPNDLKLSKSAGDTSIRHLRLAGRKPAEIFQLIAGKLGYERPVKSWRELAATFLPELPIRP